MPLPACAAACARGAYTPASASSCWFAATVWRTWPAPCARLRRAGAAGALRARPTARRRPAGLAV